MNTPHDIRSLAPNQIFVFGSNTAGIHGLGAARTARQLFGAVHGVGMGRTGQSYGIATKNSKLETLPLPAIQQSVNEFLHYARAHPELEFLVTLIGCGYAGYRPDQIGPMFQNVPENVILPVEFS
jgi:hypothetical protein